MTAKALAKKAERLEREIKLLWEPKPVLGKIVVDEAVLAKTARVLFDFDTEQSVSKKDVHEWK
ncbi:MAG: hypothetical protein HY897_14770 [Deltaproteobacteria bacterium]|nr:hypothetical protein [Deltaproteobacteria bacterium]